MNELIDMREGLKFLRVIHLVRVSDVLQLLKIVKNRTAIHLTWAASVVATVWTCGACVFYMVGGHGTIPSPGSDALSAYIYTTINFTDEFMGNVSVPLMCL